jgi:stage V sporulation protein R
MFMHNFLTPELVRKLKLYLYAKRSNPFVEELVITDAKAKEVCEIIIRSFAHSGIPKVFVTNGNYLRQNELYLKHEHIGADLNPEYAQKPLEHIQFLWGEKCNLETIKAKQKFIYTANKSKEIENLIDID